MLALVIAKVLTAIVAIFLAVDQAARMQGINLYEILTLGASNFHLNSIVYLPKDVEFEFPTYHAAVPLDHPQPINFAETTTGLFPTGWTILRVVQETFHSSLACWIIGAAILAYGIHHHRATISYERTVGRKMVKVVLSMVWESFRNREIERQLELWSSMKNLGDLEEKVEKLESLKAEFEFSMNQAAETMESMEHTIDSNMILLAKNQAETAKLLAQNQAEIEELIAALDSEEEALWRSQKEASNLRAALLIAALQASSQLPQKQHHNAGNTGDEHNDDHHKGNNGDSDHHHHHDNDDGSHPDHNGSDHPGDNSAEHHHHDNDDGNHPEDGNQPDDNSAEAAHHDHDHDHDHDHADDGNQPDDNSAEAAHHEHDTGKEIRQLFESLIAFGPENVFGMDTKDIPLPKRIWANGNYIGERRTRTRRGRK
ncbi:hypothetical protein MMC06_003540 [Schaereria dolodes]|nr:hypothetical protein [Schaereria dolodes]